MAKSDFLSTASYLPQRKCDNQKSMHKRYKIQDIIRLFYGQQFIKLSICGLQQIKPKVNAQPACIQTYKLHSLILTERNNVKKILLQTTPQAYEKRNERMQKQNTNKKRSMKREMRQSSINNN